jgi:hypothetical protein
MLKRQNRLLPNHKNIAIRFSNLPKFILFSFLCSLMQEKTIVSDFKNLVNPFKIRLWYPGQIKPAA